MGNEVMGPTSERKVDEIVMVTDDIFRTLENFRRVFRYSAWVIGTKDDTTEPGVRAGVGSFRWHEAAASLANGFTLKIVEPVSGDTMYQKFLDRFGCGIMGLRERVKDERWEACLKHFEEKGIKAVQSSEQEVWFDFLDPFGAMHGLVKDSAPRAAQTSEIQHEICQVCIVTDDVERTARQMTELLLMGPWEIGYTNNQTVTDMASSLIKAGSWPKSEFKPGIKVFGNLEFELVQPVEGPIPYFDYLKRRTTGFHHMKEKIPDGKWEETLQRFADLGVGTLLSGKIGPCGFSNLDTEELIGCVYELSDGAEMDKLPDGYNPYFCPA
ncbi:MAG: VOC family protein [Lachnospiraceae bacterium]|nr:VOC family protein [Lachnospiraceae bacterium]